MSPSRIVCVNCGLCVNPTARHNVLEQDKKVIAFIADKIYPRVVTNHDNICQACLNSVTRYLNQTSDGEISNNVNDSQLDGRSPTQVVGYSRVCLMCGCSILQRNSA